jgi:hypothetical protein
LFACRGRADHRDMRRLALLALAACGSSDTAPGADAAIVPAPMAPAALYGPGVAFDSARARLVVFGGVSNTTGYSGDTWEWDGASWTRTSRTGPAPRNGAVMAFDSRRGRTVLFGGDVQSGEFGDTWEWDGAAWTRVAESGPRAREGHTLVFDPDRGVSVLFGGLAGDTTLRDTWEWNGATWTRVAESGPPARFLHGGAYDPRRRVTVIYGGDPSFPPPDSLADTWEWNGATWTRAADGPGPRDHVGLAYDVTLEKIVMAGGSRFVGEVPFDVHAWDGAAWSRVSESAPGLVNARLACCHTAASFRAAVRPISCGSGRRAAGRGCREVGSW